jgi:hypothetical protein
MKYNNETLVEYCNTNNIVLLKNYENIKRESYIEGKCTYENCENNFNKNFRQLVKTGAYCGECMTKITNDKIRNFKTKYDIDVLNKFCDENSILLTDDYSNKIVNRDTIIEGFCKNENCKNIFSKSVRQLLKINGYCENCSKENGKAKIIETNIKKYGVDNPMKCQEFKDKLKQTMINKYGAEHIFKLERIKQQIKEKSIKKFGTEYVLQCPEIRNQIKQTNLQKYGCRNPQQNEEIRNKTYETSLKKYGVKHFVKTTEFKLKTVKTNLERYGVPHHSQNAEISEKMIKNAYNKKPYILPSGNIIFIQGYENFMLDYLLSVENVDEDDIFTKRNEVPEIWYNDKTEKRCRHYVDFYIKSQNRCIEVKSTFTNQAKNNVFEKQKAAKDLGLKYEIWIFNREGELLDKYI